MVVHELAGILKYYKKVITVIFSNYNKLTVTTHSSCDAFLESTVLTSVPVDPKDVTLLVFGAGPILDLLLNRPAKETLQNKKTLIKLGQMPYES